MTCKRIVLIGSVLAVLGYGPAAWAAQPPCTSEEYHQFDFWLGHWQVHTADGTEAGENRITAEEKGCLVQERWQGSQGGTGRSLNFYDPMSEEWRQVWVSPGAIIDIRGGLSDEGSMVLEGTIVYTGRGEKHPFRGKWTLLEDGRVRQYFEQHSKGPEGGEASWQPWFEGFYSAVDAGGASDVDKAD